VSVTVDRLGTTSRYNLPVQPHWLPRVLRARGHRVSFVVPVADGRARETARARDARCAAIVRDAVAGHTLESSIAI